MPFSRAALCGLAVAGILATLPAEAQFAYPTLKIGVLTDESGPYVDSGGPGSILAAQMAVDDFGGAVKGHPVQIVDADTQNKPDVAAGIARRWFDTEGVTAIVDLPVTPIAYAVQALAKEKKKSVLITASASADFTAKTCSPTSSHWADDTHALAAGTAKAITAQDAKANWYFLTVDNAFGQALQHDVTEVVDASGGKIVGAVRYPVGLADFSSLVLQAQTSKAKYIGLASVGGDLVNIIKQAKEFGVGPATGQQLIGFLIYITDINSLGLETAQNIDVTTGFYWDQNEAARAFSKRFFAKRKAMPTRNQAEIYAAVLHYLRAADAAGTDDPVAVNKKMREMPVDYFGHPAKLRGDGRLLYDLTLYRVKKPSEMGYPWDYYAPLRTIPQDQAFLPQNMQACPD